MRLCDSFQTEKANYIYIYSMGSIYYVGLNAYQQCPKEEKTVLQKVLTKWQKYSFKNPSEVECTFRYVVLKTDTSFIVYGLMNENCHKNCISISFHGCVKAFLATDDFLIISRDNNLWKSEYTDVWLQITYSHNNDEEVMLWNDKVILKLCFLLGNQSIIILLNDGSVWQLDKDNKLSVVYNPILDKAVDISCGFEHALILTESGCVMSFGTGSHGQLGHGDLLPSTEPLQILGLGGLKVVEIAAGGWHSCAVTDSGDLYTWGWNNYGQLTEIKDDSSSDDGYGVAPLPMLVDIDENKDIRIVKVACGTRHTVVMTDQNELYSTGWNEYGQLGIDDLNVTKVNKFTKIGLQLGKEKKRLLCGPWSTVLYEEEKSKS